MQSKGPDETAHVHDDVYPHMLRMLDDTFSFGAANIVLDIKMSINVFYAIHLLVFANDVARKNI